MKACNTYPWHERKCYTIMARDVSLRQAPSRRPKSPIPEREDESRRRKLFFDNIMLPHFSSHVLDEVRWYHMPIVSLPLESYWIQYLRRVWNDRECLALPSLRFCRLLQRISILKQSTAIKLYRTLRTRPQFKSLLRDQAYVCKRSIFIVCVGFLQSKSNSLFKLPYSKTMCTVWYKTKLMES